MRIRKPKGVAIVGIFRPHGRYDSDDLARQWHRWLPAPLEGEGQSFTVVRTPNENISHHGDPDGSAERWHRDCGDGLYGDSAKAVLLWSTIQPTEFKRKKGSLVWTPPPFAVALLDNTDKGLLHHKPWILKTTKRWTIVHRFYPLSSEDILNAFQAMKGE